MVAASNLYIKHVGASQRVSARTADFRIASDNASSMHFQHNNALDYHCTCTSTPLVRICAVRRQSVTRWNRSSDRERNSLATKWNRVLTIRRNDLNHTCTNAEYSGHVQVSCGVIACCRVHLLVLHRARSKRSRFVSSEN